MANILIGGKNLIQQSGVTLTAGSADANYPVNNLKVPSARVFTRLDDLTLSYVQVDTGGGLPYNLVASIGHTATLRRNWLTQTEDVDGSADWTKTNVTVTAVSGTGAGSSATATKGAEIFQVEASGGLTTHILAQSDTLFGYTARAVSAAEVKLGIVMEVRVSSATTTHVRVGFDLMSSTITGRVSFNLSTGAINSSSATSGWSVANSSITALAGGPGDWYEIAVVLESTSGASFGSATTLNAKVDIDLLDSSFGTVFTPNATAEGIWITAVRAGFDLDAGSAYDANSTSEHGAVWQVKYDDSAVLPTTSAVTAVPVGSLGASEGMAAQRDVQGWGNAWAKTVDASGTESRMSEQHLLFEWHNPGNAGTTIDVSGIGLYDAFEPTVNFNADWSVQWEEDTDPSLDYAPEGRKRRLVSLELHYLTQTEALQEVSDILLRLGKSRQGFFVLNPDETAVGQQLAIYGRVVDHRIRCIGYSSTQSANVYSATLAIREDVP